MTVARAHTSRALDAPDDRRRCTPAEGADRAPDAQGAAAVPHPTLADRVRLRAHRHPRRADDPRMAPAPDAAAPVPPAAAVAAHTRVEAVAMRPWRAIVTDDVLPALAERAGARSASTPQPRHQAPALASMLLGVSQLPNDQGPSRRARPGGQRTVWLHETSLPLSHHGWPICDQPITTCHDPR